MSVDRFAATTTDVSSTPRVSDVANGCGALDAREQRGIESFTEIVVPLAPDHDERRSLPVAAWLARCWNLPVRLIAVDARASGDSLAIAAEGRLEDALATLRARHAGLAVSAVSLGAVDEPAAAVDDVLTSSDFVVLAIDALGSGSAPSFAELLADRWGGPLMLIGPRARPDFEIQAGAELVMGFDGSAFAERTLPLALAMAQRFDLRLVLVQVLGNVVGAPQRYREISDAPDSESAHVRDVAERIGVGWRVVHDDDPASALVHVAADSDVPFLVLSAQGASRLARQVFGSTCRGVIDQAGSPVVVQSSYRSRPVAARRRSASARRVPAPA